MGRVAKRRCLDSVRGPVGIANRKSWRLTIRGQGPEPHLRSRRLVAAAISSNRRGSCRNVAGIFDFC